VPIDAPTCWTACSAESCRETHLAEHHAEHGVSCAVCEVDCQTDFTPVDAKVTLHRRVNVEYPDGLPGDKFLRAIGLAYSGTIWTLPVTYLCPAHAYLLPEPIKMAWPMIADDVPPRLAAR
jgi:hypothetical protein